jgi:hypothetical protein
VVKSDSLRHLDLPTKHVEKGYNNEMVAYALDKVVVASIHPENEHLATTTTKQPPRKTE